mmetsp:Transcript_93241/g.259747  ORF Transcript_93241/g.259747 Transcript_93241/m.259747 type:complete len:521 (-) Transcript_93241:139-1701(-)
MAAIEQLRLAFPHLSIEQINAALLRAGGDPNRASSALLRAAGGSGGGGSCSSPSSRTPRTPRPGPPDLSRDPEGWFRFFDRDGNGLQQQEVASAVAQTFPGIAPSAARELVKGLWPLFDVDRSGSISMREFTKRDGLREAILAQLGIEGGHRPHSARSGPPHSQPATPVVQGILVEDGSAASPSSPMSARVGSGKGGKGGRGGKDGMHGKGGKYGKGVYPASPSGASGSSLPSFEEVLAALRPLHSRLGGTPYFGRRDPVIPKKLKSSELERNSDYEYVFMTVLGFQALHEYGAEIIRLNNGAHWRQNPGTVKLEELCGFTMHGDRPGANGVLRTAPEALLRAFALARRRHQIPEFFSGEAFDRTADPCLEGRLGRILAYLEAHAAEAEGEGAAPGDPAPGEVHVEPMPEGSPVEKVVGEHLRVFRNQCIHRWAQVCGLPYERAKALWTKAEAGSPEPGAPRPDIRRFCNDAVFLRYLHAAGLVAGRPPAGGPPPKHAFPAEEVQRAVRFFVEMETLCGA